MPRINRRANNNSANYWPGFVDAMATILLVIIFLLTVFILSQFFLSTEISSKDEALIDLQSQLQELSLLLSLEQNENENLATKIGLLESDLDELFSQNEQLSSSLASSNDEIVILQDEIDNLNLDYQSQIIVLQDNIDRQIALYDVERDQSAERNQQIIKLISENKQISSLLKMRELEINNKNLKIQNIEDNILNQKSLESENLTSQKEMMKTLPPFLKGVIPILISILQTFQLLHLCQYLASQLSDQLSQLLVTNPKMYQVIRERLTIQSYIWSILWTHQI